MTLFKKNTISFLAFYLYVCNFSDSGAVADVGDPQTAGEISRSLNRLRSFKRTANSHTDRVKELRASGVSKKAAEKAVQAYALTSSGEDSGMESDDGDPFIHALQEHIKSQSYWDGRERKAEEEALEFGVFGLAHLNAAKDPHMEFLGKDKEMKQFNARTLDVETTLFPTLHAISVSSDLEDSRSLFEDQLKEKEALVRKYKEGMDLEKFLQAAYDLEGRGLVEAVKSKREMLVKQYEDKRNALAKEYQDKKTEEGSEESFKAQLIAASNELFGALMVLEGEKMAYARMEILAKKPAPGGDLDSVAHQSSRLAQKYGALQHTVRDIYDLLYATLSDEGHRAISGGEKVYDAFVGSKKVQAAAQWFRTKFTTEQRVKQRKGVVGAFKSTQRIFLQNLEILRQSRDEEVRALARRDLQALNVDPALIEELSDVQKTPDLKKRVKAIFRYLRRENKNMNVIRGIFKEHARDSESRAKRKAARDRMVEYFRSLEKVIEDYKADRADFLNLSKKT